MESTLGGLNPGIPDRVEVVPGTWKAVNVVAMKDERCLSCVAKLWRGASQTDGLVQESAGGEFRKPTHKTK